MTMIEEPEADNGYPGEDILRLLYCSRVPYSKTSDEIEDDIEIILRTSREENSNFGITGVLVTDKKMYSQVIEGPPRVVKDLIGSVNVKHVTP